MGKLSESSSWLLWQISWISNAGRAETQFVPKGPLCQGSFLSPIAAEGSVPSPCLQSFCGSHRASPSKPQNCDRHQSTMWGMDGPAAPLRIQLPLTVSFSHVSLPHFILCLTSNYLKRKAHFKTNHLLHAMVISCWLLSQFYFSL